MRIILGMFLGAALTVSGAYVYDNYGNRSAFDQRTMVNWDVVNENWQAVKSRANEEWARLSSNRL